MFKLLLNCKMLFAPWKVLEMTIHAYCWPWPMRMGFCGCWAWLLK